MEQHRVLCIAALAAVCFAAGMLLPATSRVQKGTVVGIMPASRLPGYVNRWCLVREGDTMPDDTVVTVVELGSGRARMQYAVPVARQAMLAPQDDVWIAIDSCEIKRAPIAAASRFIVRPPR